MTATGSIDERRADWAAIAGVIATVSVFAIAQGLTYPLLSFILQRQGVSPAMIGLSAAMSEAGLVQSRDWWFDGAEHLPYKGIYWAASGTDSEEESVLSILLGRGDPDERAVRVESDSGVLRTLDSQRVPQRRLFVDRAYEERAVEVLKRFNVPKEG